MYKMCINDKSMEYFDTQQMYEIFSSQLYISMSIYLIANI